MQFVNTSEDKKKQEQEDKTLSKIRQHLQFVNFIKTLSNSSSGDRSELENSRTSRCCTAEEQAHSSAFGSLYNTFCFTVIFKFSFFTAIVFADDNSQRGELGHATSLPPGGGSGKYIPPSIRGGGGDKLMGSFMPRNPRGKSLYPASSATITTTAATTLHYQYYQSCKFQTFHKRESSLAAVGLKN